MSAISDELCFDAYQVASSALFKLLLLVKMLISFAEAFSVVLLFRNKGCSWIPNANAGVLYKTHIYLSFHTAFFFAVIYIIEMIRTSLHSGDPCYYILDARLSCLLRFMPVLALVIQSFNMLTFALERLVSTLCPRRYEAVSSSYFGLFLITAECSLAFVTLFIPIKSNSYVTAITAVNPQNKATFPIAVGFPLLLEVVTITVFGFTYCLNQYKSRLFEPLIWASSWANVLLYLRNKSLPIEQFVRL